MAKCQFTIGYYDFEKIKYDKFEYAKFDCEEEALGSSCILHDKMYLEDKHNFEKHKQEVYKRLMDKISDSITNNKALFCIGYQLPADIQIHVKFNKLVYFCHSKFQTIGLQVN